MSRRTSSAVLALYAVCCLLAAAGCCGYSAKSLLPPHLRTAAVPPVQNSTLQPGLDDQLTDLLVTAFNRDRSLRVTTLEQANLAVTVTITSYSRTASVYDENQTISTYDLTAAAQVDAQDQVRDETFFSGSVSAKVTYDPDTETEEAAATRLLEALAAEIVRRVIPRAQDVARSNSAPGGRFHGDVLCRDRAVALVVGHLDLRGPRPGVLYRYIRVEIRPHGPLCEIE